jgi:hypothetical protein
MKGPISKSWGLGPRFTTDLNTRTPSFVIVCKIPWAFRKVKPGRTFRNPIIVAQELQDEMKRDGISQAELARRHGLSRVLVHQWRALLELPEKDIERLKTMGDNWERRLLTERALRRLRRAG